MLEMRAPKVKSESNSDACSYKYVCLDKNNKEIAHSLINYCNWMFFDKNFERFSHDVSYFWYADDVIKSETRAAKANTLNKNSDRKKKKTNSKQKQQQQHLATSPKTGPEARTQPRYIAGPRLRLFFAYSLAVLDDLIMANGGPTFK